MKRFFALVVLIAMLTVMAAAEEAKSIPNPSIFTPSVSGKPAPPIVIGQAPDGSFFSAIIRNLKTGLEVLVPDEDFITVIAVAGRELVQNEIVRMRLKTAFETILGVGNVGELLAVSDEEMPLPEEPLLLAESLDKRLREMNLELTHEDLVIKDLFDLFVQGTYSDMLDGGDSIMEVSFVDPVYLEEPFVVIFSEDGVYWKVLSEDETTVNETGNVTIRLKQQGVTAFLTEKEEEIHLETAVQSPN